MSIKQLEYKPGLEDPKQVVLSHLGDILDKLPDLYGPRVLVATAPATTTLGRSGLLVATDKHKDEARWQGKAGLILKVNPEAFKYDPRYPNYEWVGPKPQVGDWVYYRVSDSWEIGIGGISCRVLWDSNIVGSVSDPEAIY